MKIKGLVTLVFRDKDTGEITKEITQENNVTDYWLERYIVSNSSLSSRNRGKFGPTIFISGFNPAATDPTIRLIPDVHTYGFVSSGVTSPTLTLSTPTEFAFGQFQQRFSPPPALITINVIGLTWDTYIPANRVTEAQAWVKLASPCTQADNETLDIFYRMQFPYDFYDQPSPLDINTTGINAAQADIMAHRFILSAFIAEYFAKIAAMYNGNVDFTRITRNISPSSGQENMSLSATNTINIPLRKYEVKADITLDKRVGTIVGYLAYGANTDNGRNVWARGIEGVGTNVIQNIYGHSPSADKPFFDAVNLNTGDGTMVANGDSWTNPDFPKLFKLNVTTTGGLGVGDYQFQIRNHFGTILNTWKNPWRAVTSLTYENRHIFDDFTFTSENMSGVTWDDRNRPNFIHYDIAGTDKYVIAIKQIEMCLVDLQTETGTTFRTANFAGFTPTDITQVTFNKATGDIYVGCRASGIYKIVDPTGTPVITKIDNTTTGLTGLGVSQCYGVAYGNTRLWAVFEGGMFSSADDGATWVAATFTNATITGNWSLVKFIHADFTHADQRLSLVYESGGTTYMELSILWWDETSTNDVQGLQFLALYKPLVNAYWGYRSYNAEQPWSYFNILSPSPTQNKWGTVIRSNNRHTPTTGTLYATHLSFGTNTVLSQPTGTASTQNVAFGWEKDSLGQYGVVISSIISGNNHQFNLVKDDGTFEFVQYFNGIDTAQGVREITSEGPVVYLGRMVTLAWLPSTLLRYHILSFAHVSDWTSAPFEHILYDNYGWNGSAWIKDNTGSKQFHAAAEELLDGVTIAFDDAGATQTFVANDYYTFGCLKGAWLDGGTEIEQTTGLYFTQINNNQTALEAATLSASIRSPEIFERTPNEMTWQDKTSVVDSVDVIFISGTTAGYNYGARSIEAISGTGLTNKSPADLLHGSFTFGLYTNMSVTTRQITAGLSPVAVIGTGINVNTVKYGIQIHPIGPMTGTNGFHANINIIEQGVPVASNLRTIDTIQSSAYDFEVEILNDGTVNYYLTSNDSSSEDLTRVNKVRDLLYTSVVPAPIVDYYADIALNGDSGAGVYTQFSGVSAGLFPDPRGPLPSGGRRFLSRVADDLYIAVGEFANTNGRFFNNFFAIDNSQNFNILIDGTPPTLILDSDTTTVLGAGEISVFPRQGFIRYSGSDATKSITANYQVLVNN